MFDFSDATVVALAPLKIGTARAANRGDVVPVENVSAHGWEDQVAAHGTPEAVEALGYDPYTDGAPGERVPVTFELAKANIGDVLNHVNGDPALAAQLLTQEQAADKPRVSLVEKLTAIASPAGETPTP